MVYKISKSYRIFISYYTVLKGSGLQNKNWNIHHIQEHIRSHTKLSITGKNTNPPPPSYINGFIYHIPASFSKQSSFKESLLPSFLPSFPSFLPVCLSMFLLSLFLWGIKFRPHASHASTVPLSHIPSRIIISSENSFTFSLSLSKFKGSMSTLSLKATD